MRKTYFFFVFILLLNSCKESASTTAPLEDSGWKVSIAELPKKNVLNAKALAILKNWKEYKSFEESFDRLYKTEFREDFVLTIEELIEKQKQLESASYPKKFNIPQVKGRQKVLKTYILKIKGNLEYRQNPEASIKEMVGAFNSLREQFNIVVNNNLPEDLFLNEKN